MQLALMRRPKIFNLHIRCENCLRETERVLTVPPGDDAPEDADDLLESGFLQNMPFCCGHCDSAIGRLFGISHGGSE